MPLKTYKNIKSKIRNELINNIKTKYDKNESGISGIISALQDFRNYVVVLFNFNKEVLGAVSYYISKKNYIGIDHIGVVEKRCGYGTILMQEVFGIADKVNKDFVTLITNGYSNEFYEKIGMVRINGNKLPAVYEKQLKKDKIILLPR